MIRCEHCGALQADGSKFCTECGARLPSPPPITREPAYPQSTPQQYAAPQPNPYAQQNIYAQPVPAAPQPPVYPQRQTYAPPGPVGQLKTNRGLLKLILLSIITFGIYGLVVMSAVSTDINTRNTPVSDGTKTDDLSLDKNGQASFWSLSVQRKKFKKLIIYFSNTIFGAKPMLSQETR